MSLIWCRSISSIRIVHQKRSRYVIQPVSILRLNYTAIQEPIASIHDELEESTLDGNQLTAFQFAAKTSATLFSRHQFTAFNEPLISKDQCG